MKAIIYDIFISEGIIDSVHGGGHTIREIYVPELNLYINSRSAFVDEEKRDDRSKSGSNHKEFEVFPIDIATLKSIAANLRDKNRLMDMVKDMFKKELEAQPGKVKRPEFF